MNKIMGWVRLHPYNIAQKVQIVVEHYREVVAPLLNGKAKAMVVVGSRQEAVRWQVAINKYIKARPLINWNRIKIACANISLICCATIINVQQHACGQR